VIILSHELISALRQKITPTRNLSIEHIRLDLLKHNTVTGSLLVNVRDASGYLIKSSSSITIASIDAAAYFHGMIRFDINVSLKSGTTYIIELASTGYTYSTSTFVGWNNDFDLRNNDVSYSSSFGISAALRMELWERVQVRS